MAKNPWDDAPVVDSEPWANAPAVDDHKTMLPAQDNSDGMGKQPFASMQDQVDIAKKKAEDAGLTFPNANKKTLPIVWNATMGDGNTVQAYKDSEAGGYLFPDSNRPGQFRMLVRMTDGSINSRPFQYADPTEGMSKWQKITAGAGKSVVDVGRGIQQLVATGDKAQQLAQENEAIKQQDAPLMATGAGKVGYGLGSVGQMIAGGGATRLLGAGAEAAGAARLGKAIGTAGNAIIAPKTYPGALAVGAGMGAIQPASNTGERITNTALGAGAGVAGQVAGNALGRGVSAVADKVAANKAASAIASGNAVQSPLDVNVIVTLSNAGIDVGKLSQQAQQGLKNAIDNYGDKLTPDAVTRMARAAALQFPVNLTKASALGDFTAQQAESGLALMPQGDALRLSQAATDEALTKNMQGVIAKQKPTVTELDPLGKSIQGALAKAEDSSLTRVGNLYKQAEQSGANTGVNVSPIVDGVMKHIDALRGGNDAGPLGQVVSQMKRLGYMTEDANGVFHATAKTMPATEAMEMYKGLNKAYKAGSVSSGHIADVKRGIMDSLNTAQAGPEFKAATDSFRQHAKLYDNPRMISDLLKTNAADEPKVAADKVFRRIVLNGSIDEIGTLKNLMQTADKSIVDPATGTTARQDAAQAFRNLRSTLAQYLMEKSFVGNSVNAMQEPIFSGTNMTRAIKQIGGGTLDSNLTQGWAKIEAVMGKKATDELKNIHQVALDATQKVNGANKTSGTAERLISLLGHIPLVGGPTKMVANAAVTGVKNQLSREQAKTAAAGMQGMMTKQVNPLPVAAPAVAMQSALSR